MKDKTPPWYALLIIVPLLAILTVHMIGAEEKRLHKLTLMSDAPIEVEGAAKGGELPPPWRVVPDELEICAGCINDEGVYDAMADAWPSAPRYFKYNSRYGQLAFNWLLETCPDCGPVTPRELHQAVSGGDWLLGYYQKLIVDCRGSDRPCIGRRQVPTGERNVFLCQYWVMTYSPAVEAMVRIARDGGALDEAGPCPQPVAAARHDEPPYKPQSPDPGLYPGPFIGSEVPND